MKEKLLLKLDTDIKEKKNRITSRKKFCDDFLVKENSEVTREEEELAELELQHLALTKLK